MAPSDLVDAALDADLDGVAVTDHDTVRGAERVAAVAPDALTVVPGAEVTTSQGHMLALGIDTTPPVGEHPLDVIREIHEQDGVAILAHPFDSLRQTYTEDLDGIGARVDAVEVRNSRCVRRAYNERAVAFARAHDLPVTGGSDGHFPMEVGRAYTEIPDRSIRTAIRDGEVSPGGRGGYLSGHVATKGHQAMDALERALPIR